MLYSLERLETEAKESRAAAGILFNARDLLAYGIPQANGAETIKAVKQVFILRGAGKAAEWALDNIPGFASDGKEAAARVKQIIEQEKSGEAVIDALCERYRTEKGARQRKEHNPEYLTERAAAAEAAARLIKEGQQIRQENGLPAADENSIIKAVKEKYIETEAAGKVAEWAFNNIPGFALTISKAKERVKWIIDAEKCGEAAIDTAADGIRDRNRKRARLIAAG